MDKTKIYTEEQVQKLIADKTKRLADRIDEQRSIIESQAATILQVNNEIAEYRSKDSTISLAIISAVEKAQQIESTSKKLYQLEIERIRLLYLNMQNALKQLYSKYPDLRKDKEIAEIMDKVGLVLSSNVSPTSSQPIMKMALTSANNEDPIKKLLNKITTIFDKNETQRVTLKRRPPESESGFDLKEALNPTEQLADIMKAFNIQRDRPESNN